MIPVRPAFRDGAILAASDLSTLEQVGRDRDARHARHLHTPGVAAGLTLTPEDRKTTGGVPYVEVTLRPGYAIDGTGRELVVAEPLPLSADRFNADNPNPQLEKGETFSVWYPVFIRGVDAATPTSTGPTGCQGGAGASRVQEDIEIEFGRPGDESAEQPVPAPDAGPGDGSWRVLVGFVRVTTTSAPHRFLEVSDPAVMPVPEAGVRAGVVAGRSGSVEIRPRATAAAGVPAVIVRDADGGSLVFGLHNGSGSLVPLMAVDSSGNLKVEGTVEGVLSTGSVLVASGTAFDGTVLPLPAGIMSEDGVEVAVQVTPRYPDLALAPSVSHRFHPAECRVDADRRVHCWGTWINGANTQDASAACDYLVLVSVPQGGA